MSFDNDMRRQEETEKERRGKEREDTDREGEKGRSRRGS